MPVRLWIVLLLVALTGCAPRGSTRPLEYTGAVSASSARTAVLRLNAGVRAGLANDRPERAVAGSFMPVAIGPDPERQFHEQDQRRFVATLQRELVRLGLFRAVYRPQEHRGGADVVIEVLFPRTVHEPRQRRYVLHVLLLVRSAQDKLAASYRVVSTHEAFGLSGLAGQDAGAKRKAAQQLLDFMIPDLEEFVRRSRHGLTLTARER